MSAIDPASLPDEPRPSISPLRVLVALLVIALLAGGGYALREATKTDPALAKVKGGRGPGSRRTSTRR